MTLQVESDHKLLLYGHGLDSLWELSRAGLISTNKCCAHIFIRHQASAPAGFFVKGGQIHTGVHFKPQKNLTTFLVVVLKTQTKTTKWTIPTLHVSPAQQRLTVTANAQNTLQHFQGTSAPPCPCLRGIAEFAGLENDGLEYYGVEQEETYILHTMKWTQTNVYDT